MPNQACKNLNSKQRDSMPYFSFREEETHASEWWEQTPREKIREQHAHVKMFSLWEEKRIWLKDIFSFQYRLPND